jgi:hypothetical protein
MALLQPTAPHRRRTILLVAGTLVSFALATTATGGCARETQDEDAAPAVHPPKPAIPSISAQQQGLLEREPAAGVDCHIAARETLLLADVTAYNLCVGASSAGPAQCFAAARERSMLVDPQIVELCRCATSAAPVACVERGRAELAMTDSQLATMCSAVVTQQLRWSNCASLALDAQ